MPSTVHAAAPAFSPIVAATTMQAAVFVGPDRVEVRTVPRPRAGVGEAVLRVTLTTICGTDVHILRGEKRLAVVPREVGDRSHASFAPRQRVREHGALVARQRGGMR